MFWFIAIVINLGIAIIPANIASEKGKSFWTWYIYAVFLFPIAFFHSLFLKEEKKQEENKDYISRLPDIKISTNNTYVEQKQIPEKVDVNAVVNITNYKIELRNGNPVLNVCLKSKAEKNIQAVKVKITGFNSFKEPIQVDGNTYVEVLIQDLNMNRRRTYQKEVILKNELSEARIFDLYVSQICYSDGEIQNCLPPQIVKTQQKKLANEYIDFAKNRNKRAQYYMIDYGTYWQCVCGNVCTTTQCDFCQMNKEKAQQLSVQNIEQAYQAFLKRKRELEEKQEKRKKEEEEYLESVRKREQEYQEQQKKKRQKNLKHLVIVIVCMMIIFTGAMLYNNFYIPNSRYKQAINYMENANYQEALNILTDIKEYKNSKDYIRECYYCLGMLEYNNKNYEAAIDYFRYSSEYNDAISMISNAQNEIDYLKFKEYLKNERYELALYFIPKIPSNMSNMKEYTTTTVIEVAQKYIDDKKYTECISLLEKYNLDNIDIYKEAQYQQAKSLLEIKDYDAAIEKFKKLSKYKDSEEMVKKCEDAPIYDRAIDNMTSGNLEEAISLFSKLNNSYNENINKYIKLCQQYKKYCTRWEGIRYRIDYLDGRGEKNLDYSASEKILTSEVRINETGEVEFRLEGIKAQLDGNIATWEAYDGGAQNTFNFNSGERITKFYDFKTKKKLEEIYRYTYKKIE